MGWMDRLFGKREAVEPAVYVPPEPVVAPWSTSGFIYQVGNDLQVNTSTVAEARLAIKDLKHQKKQVAGLKRQLTQEMAAIRTQAKMKSAATYGTYGKRSIRQQTLRTLVPYENRKIEYDRAINTIDLLIQGVEARLLEHEADKLQTDSQ